MWSYSVTDKNNAWSYWDNQFLKKRSIDQQKIHWDSERIIKYKSKSYYCFKHYDKKSFDSWSDEEEFRLKK